MSAAQAIDTFSTTLLLPLFDEIGRSPRLAEKGRTVWTVNGPSTGDAIVDDALAAAHPRRRHMSAFAAVPAEQQSGEWVGATLVILESAEKRAPYAHPQAGRFYLSVLYRLPGDGRVLVSPWVFYWMRFNDKLHAFAHRYHNEIADQPIEDVTRKDLVNHALGALSAFDITAFSPTRPF